MTLSFQVAFDGKRSATGDTLLDEIFGGFEGVVVVGVVIVRFGACGAEAEVWGFGLRLALDRGLRGGRGERDRLRTGAGKH
jgi:hypothetical protein